MLIEESSGAPTPYMTWTCPKSQFACSITLALAAEDQLPDEAAGSYLFEQIKEK